AAGDEDDVLGEGQLVQTVRRPREEVQVCHLRPSTQALVPPDRACRILVVGGRLVEQPPAPGEAQHVVEQDLVRRAAHRQDLPLRHNVEYEQRRGEFVRRGCGCVLDTLWASLHLSLHEKRFDRYFPPAPG